MTKLMRPTVMMMGLLTFSVSASAAELKPKTARAFDHYVAVTEQRMAGELKPGGAFLYADRPGAESSDEMRNAYARLQRGEILVQHLETKLDRRDLDVPGGMVHHWVGLAFIPGANLAQALAVAQDYDHRAELYKPEVVAAHLISHQGDDYKIFMRLYQKRFTTVAFNTEYAIHWGRVDENKLYANSISTRIAEVKDPSRPDGPELPVGHGNGYLWRLNTYWRFEEKDGGVYMQCEAVSLTRDIPFGLGWLIKPLVTKIPKQSLSRALGRTREVVLEKMKARQVPIDPAQVGAWQIPRAGAGIVNGVMSPGEWEHAARMEITVAKDWVVTVFARHDNTNLYLAFTGLTRGGQERYPEVMLDPRNERTLSWQPGQWWLHASYNLCESDGHPSEYTNCRAEQQGWTASRFPLKSASEFAISLDKVGLQVGKAFGLAFDVTDTHGQWAFWPSTAEIEIPMTWQQAQLQ